MANVGKPWAVRVTGIRVPEFADLAKIPVVVVVGSAVNEQLHGRSRSTLIFRCAQLAAHRIAGRLSRRERDRDCCTLTGRRFAGPGTGRAHGGQTDHRRDGNARSASKPAAALIKNILFIELLLCFGFLEFDRRIFCLFRPLTCICALREQSRSQLFWNSVTLGAALDVSVRGGSFCTREHGCASYRFAANVGSAAVVKFNFG